MIRRSPELRQTDSPKPSECGRGSNTHRNDEFRTTMATRSGFVITLSCQTSSMMVFVCDFLV